MRLGILGGTFNPIHLGHLVLAETARETLALDRVVFIPTRIPPHKRVPDLLPAPVRLALVRLAIRGHPAFVASALEAQRPGPSYSIDTVEELRKHYPTATLFLLMGEDMLAVRWASWERLRRLCTIVVAHRAGSRPTRRARVPFQRDAPHQTGERARTVPAQDVRHMTERCDSRVRCRTEAAVPLSTHVTNVPQPHGGPSAEIVGTARGVTWLPMPLVAIASSEIRTRLRSGRSIRYLVPSAVERYLHRHRLYHRRTASTKS